MPIAGPGCRNASARVRLVGEAASPSPAFARITSPRHGARQSTIVCFWSQSRSALVTPEFRLLTRMYGPAVRCKWILPSWQ